MNKDDQFEFTIDNSFLKFVGREMYETVPSIISELVSNSWDADAKNVEIIFDTKNEKIIVKPTTSTISLGK